MNSEQRTKIIRVTSAVVTGVIALSAYAGVFGLMSGGISFGDVIDARLPFGSLVLAGVALLIIVAIPMTVASIAAMRATRRSADLVFGAGLLLVVLDRRRTRLHQGLLLVPPDLPRGRHRRAQPRLADDSGSFGRPLTDQFGAA